MTLFKSVIDNFTPFVPLDLNNRWTDRQADKQADSREVKQLQEV